MIVVTGATGSIGRSLVAELQAAGAPLRAMVRDVAAARSLGAELVHGDFDQPETLRAAFAGAEQLFLNAGGAEAVEGPQPMIRQQVAAIDAARAEGIQHVVKVSVHRAAPGRPLAEGAHAEIEQYLHGSGMDVTLLRPNGFMQNFISGVAGFTPEGALLDVYGGARVSYIDAADIAACAAAVLCQAAGRGSTHILTGPEALTTADVAARIAAVVARRVPVVEVEPAALRSSLINSGLPTTFADDLAALCAEVATGALETTTDAVAALTGRAPNTFLRFAALNAAALSRAVSGH
ncbi:MAG TPA: NmrA family NAD(P)-binding protein [Pseudonocardia sp.]